MPASDNREISHEFRALTKSYKSEVECRIGQEVRKRRIHGAAFHLEAEMLHVPPRHRQRVGDIERDVFDSHVMSAVLRAAGCKASSEREPLIFPTSERMSKKIMFSTGTISRVRNVANIRPKVSVMAIGIRNFA